MGNDPTTMWWDAGSSDAMELKVQHGTEYGTQGAPFDEESQLNGGVQTRYGVRKPIMGAIATFMAVCLVVALISMEPDVVDVPLTSLPYLEDGTYSCTKSIAMPINQCFDLVTSSKQVITQLMSAVGMQGSSISAVEDYLMPIVNSMLLAFKAFTAVDLQADANFCMGTFPGSVFTKPPNPDPLGLKDLGSNGCKNLPLDPVRKYSVISLAIPTPVAAAFGLCTVGKMPLSLCMAFGECENGLPTFAFSMDGALMGCMADNPTVASATAGIGLVVGKAAAMGINSFGFGLSASGAFTIPAFSLWAGNGYSLVTVPVSANVYMSMSVMTTNALPPAVSKYIKIVGTSIAMIQFGEGNMATQVAQVAKASNITQALEEIVSARIMGKMSIKMVLKLAVLTNKVLPSMTLGSAFVVQAMLSTETVNGLPPGAYFHASDGFNLATLMQNTLTWAATALSGTIDKMSGSKSPATSILQNAAKNVNKMFPAGKSSNPAAQVGLYLNTESFGIMLIFPVGNLFPFLKVPSGTIHLNCEFHYANAGLICGLTYDKPMWIAAIGKNGQMVIGNVKTALSNAMSDLKTGIQDDWTVISGGVVQAWGNVKNALTPDGGKKITGAFAAAKKAKLGGGRKIKAWFSGWRI